MWNKSEYLFKNTTKLGTFMNNQRKLAGKLKDIFEKEVSDMMTVLSNEANFVFTYDEVALELGEYIR
ncbi:hypothetical protein [Carnobacterium iners]|uniref:hypothetical protein n=1 Tax=Carnobacterium iners TaxID=1073423 RepID=UPI000A1CBC79|nr:hypothetical protein [Carnobacterium iners]